MKNFILFSTLVVSTVCNQLLSQTPRLYFEELDQAIIEVWNDNQQNDYEALGNDIAMLSLEWEKVRIHLSQDINCEHAFCESFCAEIDYAISAILVLSNRNRYEYIEGNILYLVQEFASLRDAYDIENYPLDQLWMAYKFSYELSLVANDPMLDLLEWQELEEIYCAMIDEWHSYNHTIDRKNITDLNYEILMAHVDQEIANLQKAKERANQRVVGPPTTKVKDAIAALLVIRSKKNKPIGHSL